MCALHVNTRARSVLRRQISAQNAVPPTLNHLQTLRHYSATRFARMEHTWIHNKVFVFLASPLVTPALQPLSVLAATARIQPTI
jgi:hypothetical protein